MAALSAPAKEGPTHTLTDDYCNKDHLPCVSFVVCRCSAPEGEEQQLVT